MGNNDVAVEVMNRIYARFVEHTGCTHDRRSQYIMACEEDIFSALEGTLLLGDRAEPISPAQCTRQYKLLNEMLTDGIVLCNQKLLEEHLPGWVTIVDIPGKSRIARLLVEKFQQAGWDVSFTDDQRDGCHLSFTDKPE